jgi:diguanylate cyclase (GGDEF)-like protein/PAS domain S-box-containing protein
MVTLSSEGILVADAQDARLPVVYANPAYLDLSGYSAEELAGNSWPLAKRDGEGEPELAKLKAALGRAESCEVTVPDLRKDGTSWSSRVSVEPLYNARGELKYFLCIQRPATDRPGTERPAPRPAVEPPADVPAASSDTANVAINLLESELGRARDKIATSNRVDAVTGLLRFDYFQEMLQRDLGMARRDRRTVSVMVFEIVEFDAYRRTFGSKSADSCQRMIGAQITRTLRRAGDLCTRYDDSTLVAAAVGQAPEELRRLADQIADNVRRLALHNPRAKSGRHVTIRCAVVACEHGNAEDVETVIARARSELHGSTAAETPAVAT